ncbi:hypothetical protein [Microcoleus sp. FACHB-672]|nr:hypothetical protein [Microcoleus sp. FACHB-672]
MLALQYFGKSQMHPMPIVWLPARATTSAGGKVSPKGRLSVITS